MVEQDACWRVDEIEVPGERVFIAGDLDVYGNVMKHGWAANIIQQTGIRAAVRIGGWCAIALVAAAVAVFFVVRSRRAQA